MAFTLLLLAAGALTFWRRPDSASARAFLATTVLVPMALTASPWGLGAIDLAGGRGAWPHAGGEILCALGIGTALVAAVTLTGMPEPVQRHPWALGAAYLVPIAGYAVWAIWSVTTAGPDQSDAARLQALLTVVGPALLATAPAVLGVTGVLYVRSVDREDRLATRLVLLAVGGGLAARVLLGDLPQRLAGGSSPTLATAHPVRRHGGARLRSVAIQRYRLGGSSPPCAGRWSRPGGD